MPFIDPHSYTDLTQGRIAHVSMAIEIDFPQRVLRIDAHYQMDRPVRGSLFLDTRVLAVESITSDGRTVDWALDEDDPILGQRLHLQHLNGQSEFEIRLSTSPESSALQWMEPAQTAGGRQPYLYTQCQAIHARSIFPCQDSPSVRFTFEAELRVPSEVMPVMAAAHLDTRQEGGSTVARFTMPQPIPAYLFAFGVGDFRFRELGPRTGIYAEPEILDAAVWEFAENEQKIIEAEKLLGPYLWDRYDLLIMPPSFPYGAMENPRLTFMSPIFIVGNRQGTNIVTHELAHAWTGNLVTNATWEDFWLNEGWTTYAESRISDVLEGVDWSRLAKKTSRLLMLEAMRRFGMESDETKLFFSQKGIDPDEVFSSIPYHKGCAFIMALEEAVGQPKFDQFIKTYISTFSFRSLSTEGFVEFLRQELPDVFKRVDVDEWLYAPGFPDDAPVLRSAMYDEVEEAAAATKEGRLPTLEQAGAWHREQVLLYLRLMDEALPVADCRTIEGLFGLDDSGDATLVSEFLLLAVRSGYQDALPSLKRIISSVGRSSVILRLFRLMVKTDWTRDLARPLFERYRHRHHPATVARVEGILHRADL